MAELRFDTAVLLDPDSADTGLDDAMQPRGFPSDSMFLDFDLDAPGQGRMASYKVGFDDTAMKEPSPPMLVRAPDELMPKRELGLHERQMLYPFPLAPSLTGPTQPTDAPMSDVSSASGDVGRPSSLRSADSKESKSQGKESSKEAGKKPLSAKEWTSRREKHNQMEQARRKRLQDQFQALHKAVKSDDKSQAGILRAAIAKLKEYEDKVKKLSKEKEEKSKAVLKLDGAEVPKAVATPGDAGHYHAFLHSGVAMSVSLMNGQILDVNDQFADLFKNQKASFKRLSVFTMTHPDFRPKCYQMVNQLLTKEKTSQETSMRLLDCKGKMLSVHVTSWVVEEDNKPKYLVAMLVPLEVEPKEDTVIDHSQ